MFRCPAFLLLKYTSYNELSSHILDCEKIGSAEHIMWLNRNVSSKKISLGELSKKLDEFFRADSVKQ